MSRLGWFDTLWLVSMFLLASWDRHEQSNQIERVESNQKVVLEKLDILLEQQVSTPDAVCWPVEVNP